ncbi:hypothetical protein [Peptoclostridium acidaminophilum]|nr:hypothetical protein [Peptoclostridium acidaminophilum]
MKNRLISIRKPAILRILIVLTVSIMGTSMIFAQTDSNEKLVTAGYSKPGTGIILASQSSMPIKNYYETLLIKQVSTYKSNQHLKALNAEEEYINNTTYGNALDWWSQVRGKLVKQSDILKVKDFNTGKIFTIVIEGGTNHADIEPLTTEDAEIIKELWGGSYNWSRRPVIVFAGSEAIAASMNGMPHAGVDDQPHKAITANRSAGYGRGINYDMIKNNGVDGHFCLHFKNSMLHVNGKVDSAHQAAVRVAGGGTY